MRNHKYGPLFAVVLSACTFTTADVGPTATSLRAAHDGLASEFSALDARAAPSPDTIQRVCDTRPVESTEGSADVQRAAFVTEFCARWSGLTPQEREERRAELGLRRELNQTLAALLAYIEALDALVKSREQSEVQADLLQARIEGLSTVVKALGGPASFISESAASVFASAADAFDSYNRTRAAYEAARQAQPGLDRLAAGVRALLGECDVALTQRMIGRDPAAGRERVVGTLPESATRCSEAVGDMHEEMVSAVVEREQADAELQHEVGYTLYRVQAPGALGRLRDAYAARARARAQGHTEDEAAANRAIDIALRDLDALERARPAYEAVMLARRTAVEWGEARTRGRRATAEAFVQAAEQNAALVEAIRRERQLDLGPLGFVIRSLLGA